MIHLITTFDYSVIAMLETDKNLSEKCRQAEQQRNDGFAVFASHDGIIIADADGYITPVYSTDAATQTGMYDGW